MIIKLPQRVEPYSVTPEAIEMGRFIGLGGDVERRIKRMARRSAPFTDVRGNRRFDDFVLTVEDHGQFKVVASVDRL